MYQRPPSSPSNLTTTSVAGNQVTLSWAPATDNIAVTSYDIYRDGLIIKNVPPTTSYTDTTVAPGGTRARTQSRAAAMARS